MNDVEVEAGLFLSRVGRAQFVFGRSKQQVNLDPRFGRKFWK